MSKYKDIDGVGKSTVIPRVKHETPAERHARRKAHNLRLRKQLESFCNENGIGLQITNKGHHWRASKNGMLIEWWPSSAKVIINKHWQRGIHVHDIYQFQELLKRKFQNDQV